MNVLSLFDGMSCCYLALKKIGIEPKKYYAAEIDKFAIKAQKIINPNVIQIGSVTDWPQWNIDYSKIDLVTGGFPCQAWSMAGKQLGDKDERGMLFWVMLDIMKEVLKANPKAKFLIENVKMKKEFEEYITYHTKQALGDIHKILINSALLSAQNRNRYYWTNWHVQQPEDKGIVLADIVQQEVDANYNLSEAAVNRLTRNGTKFIDESRCKSKTLTALDMVKLGTFGNYIKCGAMRGRNIVDGKRKDIPGAKTKQRIELRKDEKTNCLTSVQKDNLIVERGAHYRKLTPLECARLQTVPDEIIYALQDAGISNTQLYKMLGNGWTVDVIAHIFSSMNERIKKENKQGELFE